MEQALPLQPRCDPPLLLGAEDHRQRDVVGQSSRNQPEQRQHKVGSRDPEHSHLNQSDVEAEIQAGSDQEPERVGPGLLEHPVQHSLVADQVGDDHVLQIEDLIEVLAQDGQHVPCGRGCSALNVRDHGALGGAGHGGPYPRLVLGHDRLNDFVGRVVQRAFEFFRQLVRVYARKELIRSEHLGGDGIDSDPGHLGGMLRDLPLPAEVGADALELDRVEDHLHGDDLGKPPQNGRREGHGDVHPERLVEAEEAEARHSIAGDYLQPSLRMSSREAVASIS